MRLTSQQILENKDELNAILDDYFPAIKNRQALAKRLLDLLAQAAISLKRYTGQFRQIIISAIASMRNGDHFNLARIDFIFQGVVSKISHLERQERNTFKNQRPEQNILRQLKEKGYIRPHQLLTHTDIKQMFDANLASCPHTDPISVTDDGGTTLAAALKAYAHLPGKLLIPANLNGNHWVLIVRETNGNQVTVRTWDPLPACGRTGHAASNIIQSAVQRVYQEKEGNTATAEYHFAGVQTSDSVTCGDRITKQAFVEAGLNNKLTQASDVSAAVLRSQFVKMLVQTDADLQAIELEEIEGHKSLIYDKNALPDSQELQEMICASDEDFALILQKIYKDDVDITDADAVITAKQQLGNGNLDLGKTRVEVTSWIEERFLSKNASGFFKHKTCAEEQRAADLPLPQVISCS